MRFSREIRIAFLFLAALALLIWGINFMKGKNIFRKERTFFAVYERTAGLGVNNPVLINGHQVGLVRQISFMENDPQARLLVKIGITDKLPIPSDSRAVIETNLLGSNMVNIQLGSSAKMLKANDTLLSQVATTLQEQFSIEMLPVKKKAENVMLSLDTVLTVIRSVFNAETRMNLTLAMENIRRSIETLRNTTYNIDTLVSSQRNRLSLILSNVESITSNFENNNETLNRIITNIGNISDTLARVKISSTLMNADKAIADFSQVVTKINEGDGSLSMLINDKQLYYQLQNASTEMKELIRDIKLYPDRYLHFSIFGRKGSKNPFTLTPDSLQN
ncbi:MAG TPA: MlaD family protein [Bacteroidales bacterium]|nr:MlaD family protein [Bacteroidales bacterium]HRZ49643.1 MlaD family protein [Bacteroidales bacterium]